MSTYQSLIFAPLQITDVFETMKASSAWFDKVHLSGGEGDVPYLSQTQSSNGIAAYVTNQGVLPEPGNCITVTLKTQSTFYQPVEFYTAQNFLLFRHRRLNKHSGLVLTAIMQHALRKFSWGYGVSMARLSKTRIMVPVAMNADGEEVVDWDGMARFGEELFAEAEARAVSARKYELGDAATDLPDLQYEPMFITEVFQAIRSSSAWYDKTKLRPGEEVLPFVSRTKTNNGIDGFVSGQEKAPEPGNAVTIGLDTQTVSYQPVPFYTSQNIQVLRHPRLNEENGLVLVACLREQMGKFSWGGNGATLGRLKATRIMVPVIKTNAGEQLVDWDGMTHYGKVLRARAERGLTAALAVR